MIVALSNEAMYMKDELERYGHRVVMCGRYRGRIDAVVYKGISISDVSLSNSNFASRNGVLMVDCTNRTPSEVNNYLRQRTFSSIFN